jgi:hypothetical protein
MGTNPENTRSDAFSAEQLAQINAMNTKLVGEMITNLFRELTPTLQGMALTPEKIRALNAPYTDPKVEARQKREMLLFKQDEEERLKTERAMKENCTHKDERGQTSIRLIRNFPDRNPRGICMLCHDLIHPRHWTIGAPDAENPRGKAIMAPEHKDYNTVRHIIAHS